MLPNGKRKAAVMLGSGWSSASPQQQQQAAMERCPCPRHSPRAAKTAEQKASMKAAHLGAVCCKAYGGTRVAGDAWTLCTRQDRWLTICCGCQAEIPVNWVLLSEQRVQLAMDGLNQKQIVMKNQEVLEILQAVKAGTF